MCLYPIRYSRGLKRFTSRWARSLINILPSHYLATKTTTQSSFSLSWPCTAPGLHPLLLFFFSVSWCLCVVLSMWVRAVCLLCVFSPAASVDYGSFADRCSTWLELLRLKAHTIRRGSVKTSTRTLSLSIHKCTNTHMLGYVHTHPLYACRWGAVQLWSSFSPTPQSNHSRLLGFEMPEAIVTL